MLSGCGFLCIYSYWVSLNFLGLWVDIFHQFCKIVSHYLFKYFLCFVLFSSGTPTTQMKAYLILFLSYWMFWSPFSLNVFLFVFNSDYFYCFQIQSLSFDMFVKLILYLLFCIFRITIWLFFRVLIFMPKYPICSHVLSTFSMRFLSIFIIVILKSSLIILTLNSSLNQVLIDYLLP